LVTTASTPFTALVIISDIFSSEVSVHVTGNLSKACTSTLFLLSNRFNGLTVRQVEARAEEKGNENLK
jgi:hypothetical protein